MIDITKLNLNQVNLLAEQIAPNMRSKTQAPSLPKTPITDIQAAKSIAKNIYQSKGWLTDDEQRAVKAIKSIRDNKMFELVQTELRKLTGGRGIGQYVTSFIQDGIYQAHISLNYVNSILAHLKKIKANSMTINMFTTIQYKLLIKKSQEDKEDIAIGGPELRQFWKDHHHDIMLAASIGAMFFGPIGLIVSAGISLGDAGMYYQEGDRYNAGLMAGLAILPGLGRIISKIPAIAKVGAPAMAKLGAKLATSSKPILNRLEMAIIKDMSKYQGLIKSEMDAYFKARVANEAALIARKAGAKGAKKILQKIADGSLKASVVGGRTAGQVGAGLVTFDLYNKGWDKVYVNLGMDKKDIHDKQKIALDKWIKQTESINMNSKHILETIIKESLQSEQLTMNNKPTTVKPTTVKTKPITVKPTVVTPAGPFKNQAEGDAFRVWLNTNYPSAARDLDLDKTGPYDNAVIKKAYNIHKKDYLQYKDDSDGVGVDDLFELSGLQLAFLVVVAGAVGIPITIFGIKTVRRISLLVKYRKYLVPLLRSGKFKDFRKLLASKKFRGVSEAQRKEMLDLLKNPGAKVQLISALDEMMIKSFVRGEEGVTAKELRDILDDDLWRKYGPEIERRQAQRDAAAAKKRGSTVSTAKPIKIKLAKVSRDAKWTSATAFNLNVDTYAAELKNAGIYGPNDFIAFKQGMRSNIEKDFIHLKSQFAAGPGSNNGVWILNSHIDANTFPNFLKWQKDLMAANPKFDVNLLNTDRYRRAKAKWYIVKNSR
jgi:hypothetical protein